MRLLVKLVLGLAVPCLLVWLVAFLLTISSGSTSAIIVLRTVLCALTLAFLTRVILRSERDSDERAWALPVGALLAYLVSPQAWSGRALFAQTLVKPGVLSFLLDLVVWEALVVLVGRTVPPVEPVVERAPYTAAG